MLGLGLGIIKSNRPSGINLASFAGIKAWYKFKTGITLDKGFVIGWEDSSGNTVQNMDLSNTGQIPYNSSDGKLTFATVASNDLSTGGDTLNLSNFTIFVVMDVVEAGARDEFVIGVADTTDSIQLYPGSDPRSVRFVANSIAYNIALSTPVPAGKILIKLVRKSDGRIDCAINETVTGSAITSISNLFDFSKIADGSSDMDFYEAVIYDTDLSSGDQDKITAHLLSEHGIS